MIRSIRHVLAVTNLARSTDYFTNVLGFVVDPDAPPGWAFVSRDGFRLMLGDCPDSPAAAETGDHSYFAHLLVDDIDALYSAFTDRGAIFTADIADREWGHREFCVRTPDGHRLMFAQIR